VRPAGHRRRDRTVVGGRPGKPRGRPDKRLQQTRLPVKRGGRTANQFQLHAEPDHLPRQTEQEHSHHDHNKTPRLCSTGNHACRSPARPLCEILAVVLYGAADLALTASKSHRPFRRFTSPAWPCCPACADGSRSHTTLRRDSHDDHHPVHLPCDDHQPAGDARLRGHQAAAAGRLDLRRLRHRRRPAADRRRVAVRGRRPARRERVLDVAAGNGNATLAAARRFAEVVSTDYVPQLLEKGRERAEADRLPVEFQVAMSITKRYRTSLRCMRS
jgi:hypothetical protein